jgi:hypothetical protein
MNYAYEYLKITMRGLANTIYNGSQGNSVSKDNILNSLKRMVEDFNNVVPEEDRINVTDFRVR